ncbi:MAG TPA: hypothetical protein VHA80_00830 [Solirubrobacterales bacterium]|nr:hypothetical protein [Solirubrobacterales bacterium]
MRVGTPLGEYPFEFRRVERRGDSIAIVGTVAGLESSLVVDRRDLRRLLTYAALPLGVAVLLAAYAAKDRRGRG